MIDWFDGGDLCVRYVKIRLTIYCSSTLASPLALSLLFDRLSLTFGVLTLVEEILTIAIVGRTSVILLRYHCNSCDTIEYIEFSAPQASSGSMACVLKHGGAYLMGNSSGC